MQPRVEQFEQMLRELLGERAVQVTATMRDPKRQGVWRNSLQVGDPIAVQAFQDQLNPTAVSGFDDLWAVSATARSELTAHDLVTAGVFYPINPSSVLAARALFPSLERQSRPDSATCTDRGLEVLDLAAAPGGKTLLLAAKMNNQGRLAAVEPVRPRFFRMQANLERCGVNNAVLYQADGRGIGQRTGPRFDAVLLDAPCSSEARVRLDAPATLEHWSPRKLRETARKQKRLLLSAFTALKPGGHLLYCTCAFSYLENEAVVAHLLRREPQAQVLDLPSRVMDCAPSELAQPGFVTDPIGRRKAGDDNLAKALRIIPDDLWDGFFMCLLTKDREPE